MFYSDYMKNFIDGGTRVPYYLKDCHYYVKHEVKECYFEHEFKIYYKNCNRYFIGIHSNDLVRRITAQDYNLVLNDKKEAEERTRMFLSSINVKKERVQLTLF